MEAFIAWSVIAALVCGGAAHMIADHKGLGAGAFWLGFLLGPLGLVIVALLPASIEAQAKRQAALQAAVEHERGSSHTEVRPLPALPSHAQAAPLRGDAASLRAALAEAEAREAQELAVAEEMRRLRELSAELRAQMERAEAAHVGMAREWDEEKSRLTAERDEWRRRAEKAESYAKSLEALEMERDALAGALAGQAAPRVRCRGCNTIFQAERGAGVYECPGCGRKVRVGAGQAKG